MMTARGGRPVADRNPHQGRACSAYEIRRARHCQCGNGDNPDDCPGPDDCEEHRDWLDSRAPVTPTSPATVGPGFPTPQMAAFLLSLNER